MDFERLLENEKEWRKHILHKLELIEVKVEDISKFKWKATGIMATIVMIAEIAFNLIRTTKGG